MDHSEIAPLAKRLAEENNVDWQRLRGSGAGGQIVERDVLEYLARVMAGEEAVDPTPEPVPEGMEAWPEADVRAGAQAEAEVDPTATLDDDIFIFDDTDADGITLDDGADDRSPAALWADDADVVDLDVGVSPSTATATVPDDDESDGLLDVGDDGLEDVMDPTPDVALADTDEDTWLGGGLEREGGTLDDPFAGVGHDAPTLDDPVERPRAGPGPDLELDDVDAASPVPERVENRELPDLFMGDADAAASEPGTSGAPGSADAAAGVAAGTSGATGADAPAPLPPVAEPVEPATDLAALPLMRHPNVWRRQVDLTALVAAQADLASEFGRGDPIALHTFMLRAGAKALAADGGGTVGLAQIGVDGVRVLPVDTSGGFGGTLAALDAALDAALSRGADGSDAGDGLALVIADLSDLGVDEATLEIAAPVLTLGRVLIDNQSGARRAYLALSGEGATGGVAARLLARVADLMERPVRLVV